MNAERRQEKQTVVKKKQTPKIVTEMTENKKKKNQCDSFTSTVRTRNRLQAREKQT